MDGWVIIGNPRYRYRADRFEHEEQSRILSHHIIQENGKCRYTPNSVARTHVNA